MKVSFFVLVVVCHISFNVVLAKPKTNTIQDHELVENELRRTKRQWGYGTGGYAGYGQAVGNQAFGQLTGGMAGQQLFQQFGQMAGQSATNSFKCSDRAGCHNGYCWAFCGLMLGTEWCYTSHSYSQSFQYASCTSDSQCNKCWKCAGSCTV